MQSLHVCAADKCLRIYNVNLIVLKLQMQQFMEVLEGVRINRFQIVLPQVEVLEQRCRAEKLVGNVAYVIYG